MCELVFTGLDSHLTEEGKEYMHWMVGNIKVRKILQGDWKGRAFSF